MITSRRQVLSAALASSALVGAASHAQAQTAPPCLTLSVKSFGATGGGVIDDTAAFNRAVAAAAALVRPLPGGAISGTQIYYTGVDIYIPAGTYLLSSTIIITSPGIGFTGDGHSQSILYRTEDYGDTILCTPNPIGAVPLEGLSFRDFGMLATHPAPTGGEHINMIACFEAIVHNVRMLGHFGGMALQSCSNIFATNIRMGAGYLNWTAPVIGSHFVRISAIAGTKFNPQPGTIFFENINFQGGSPSLPFLQYGILIDNCDLAVFSSGYCGSVSNAALIISPSTASDGIDNIHFSGVQLDGNFERSMYGAVVTNPAGGTVGSVEFTSCDFVNAGTGLYVDLVDSGSIKVSGGNISQNSAAGAYMVAGSDISLRGTTIKDNTQNVTIGGGVLYDIRIQDNFIGQSAQGAAPAILTAGPVTRANVTGNSFSRNGSGNDIAGKQNLLGSVVANNTTDQSV